LPDFELPSNDLNDLSRCINERNEFIRFLEVFDLSNKKDDFANQVREARKQLSI
jgi:hypothetical protein